MVPPAPAPPVTVETSADDEASGTADAEPESASDASALAEDEDAETPEARDAPTPEALHSALVGDGSQAILRPHGLAGLPPLGTGGLPRIEIQRVIRAEVPRIKACYQARLVKDPTLEGRVVVRFSIAKDGSVDHVTITTGLQPDVDDCIKGVVESLSFPAPKDGAPVIVNYPFVFKTQ